MSDPARSEAELRQDATSIFAAALEAVDPEKLTAEALRRFQAPSGNLILCGFGKSAAGMARGARRVLDQRIDQAVLVAPAGVQLDVPRNWATFHGGHPLPDEAGVAGAREVARLVRAAGARDLVLVLISGGGSALLTLPPDAVPLADLRQLTQDLLRAGATVAELNCVRKHIDGLKGGRLAREAAPARIHALALSDVVGDRPDCIASGPVSPDPTTFDDALEVLDGSDVRSGTIRDHLEAGRRGEVGETPKSGDPCFDETELRIIGSGRTAALAAVAEAHRLGYDARLQATPATGEAGDAGERLAELARELRRSGRPTCLVAAGETTVTVRGDGNGGPNQELALGAVTGLAGLASVLVASLDTDGIDGSSSAAGAIATGSSEERARRRGLGLEDARRRNDAYPFFESLGDLIVTGRTGTNVADIQLVLVG